MLNYKEPFNWDSVPDDVLVREFHRRDRIRRAEVGPYWAIIKQKTCPKCGMVGTTREMRRGMHTQVKCEEYAKAHTKPKRQHK